MAADAAREREQAAQTAWFEPVRYVTTRTTFVAVADRPADDPLREALLRWLHRLAVTRIAGNVIVDAAIARQRPSLMLETPERGTFSPRRSSRGCSPIATRREPGLGSRASAIVLPSGCREEAPRIPDRDHIASRRPG